MNGLNEWVPFLKKHFNVNLTPEQLGQNQKPKV